MNDESTTPMVGLFCPRCGEEIGHLPAVEEPATITCSACGREYLYWYRRRLGKLYLLAHEQV